MADWAPKTVLSVQDINLGKQLLDTMLNLGQMGILTFTYNNQRVTITRSGAGLETLYEEVDIGESNT